jgi:hypothetical protein
MHARYMRQRWTLGMLPAIVFVMEIRQRHSPSSLALRLDAHMRCRKCVALCAQYSSNLRNVYIVQFGRHRPPSPRSSPRC